MSMFLLLANEIASFEEKWRFTFGLFTLSINTVRDKRIQDYSYP